MGFKDYFNICVSQNLSDNDSSLRMGNVNFIIWIHKLFVFFSLVYSLSWSNQEHYTASTDSNGLLLEERYWEASSNQHCKIASIHRPAKDNYCVPEEGLSETQTYHTDDGRANISTVKRGKQLDHLRGRNISLVLFLSFPFKVCIIVPDVLSYFSLDISFGGIVASREKMFREACVNRGFESGGILT